LGARRIEALGETLDQLRHEVAKLRAARKRLVLAADADRRKIERDLHEGVQQHLVALTVNVQLAGTLVDADPPAAKALLEEIDRDLQQALDETARLAQSIYPPLLEAGGLAAALRSAAASAGVPAHIEVRAGTAYPPEVAGAVYFCILEVLEHAGAGARVTVAVREEQGTLAFEVVEDGVGSAAPTVRSRAELDRLRDPIEALGGQLTVRTESGGGTRVSGFLPLPDDPRRSLPGRESRL
jgi:signal transduction histidine kinase